LMFITSFEEQNITYRSCSNLRIHLCSNAISAGNVFSWQPALSFDSALSLNKEFLGSVILMYISNNNYHKK
ncbi:hypothetical protein KTI62_16405, partial [Acinetobacter schindleri]